MEKGGQFPQRSKCQVQYCSYRILSEGLETWLQKLACFLQLQLPGLCVSVQRQEVPLRARLQAVESGEAATNTDFRRSRRRPLSPPSVFVCMGGCTRADADAGRVTRWMRVPI